MVIVVIPILERSLTEHQHGTFEGNKNASASAEHSIDTGYIDSCKHLLTRILLESWYIQREKTVLNREHGLYHLSIQQCYKYFDNTIFIPCIFILRHILVYIHVGVFICLLFGFILYSV